MLPNYVLGPAGTTFRPTFPECLAYPFLFGSHLTESLIVSTTLRRQATLSRVPLDLRFKATRGAPDGNHAPVIRAISQALMQLNDTTQKRMLKARGWWSLP